MQWEHLTAPDFAKAVKQTRGICLIPAGCLEKHFDHLPLGTDALNSHKVCCLSAEKEPAVVFPSLYFGQIHEARPFPGTIALSPVLLVQLLLEVCDEVGRNGFTKIILYNGHGGNWGVLNYLCQVSLAQRKTYALYLPEWLAPGRRAKQWDSLLRTRVHGHGCECETSLSLANHPHLVKMEAIRGRKADPLGRFARIPPGRVSGRWYSDFPDHYAGDASAATVEKGRELRQLHVDTLVDFIRAVKKDQAVLKVLDDFYAQCDRLTGELARAGRNSRKR
jgi:creatinine amidohydrolase